MFSRQPLAPPAEDVITGLEFLIYSVPRYDDPTQNCTLWDVTEVNLPPTGPAKTKMLGIQVPDCLVFFPGFEYSGGVNASDFCGQLPGNRAGFLAEPKSPTDMNILDEVFMQWNGKKTLRQYNERSMNYQSCCCVATDVKLTCLTLISQVRFQFGFWFIYPPHCYM